MFKFFKNANELRRMGIALDEIHNMVLNINYMIDTSSYAGEYKEDVLILKFAFVKAILGRIEKFDWMIGSPIHVSFLPGGRGTLDQAILILEDKISLIAEKVNAIMESLDIENHENLYHSFDRSMPADLRKRLQLDY